MPQLILWGKGQNEPLKNISIGDAFWDWDGTSFICGHDCFSTGNGKSVYGWTGKIVEQGCCYLAVVRFLYLFFAVTQIVLATLRSTQTVAIAFWLSVETLLINCGINYVLIYGKTF